jgi:hypothetical protein
LLGYLLLVHLAAGVAWLTLQVPSPWRMAGLSFLVVSLAWQWRSYGLLRGAAAVRRVHWRSDGDWWLSDGEGRVQVYREVEVRLRQPWLVLLRLRGVAGRRWLLLAGDSADADTLRRLRVRLGRAAPTED